MDGYKRDFAQRVYQTSAPRIYAGAPPAMLRSIIVVSVVLDGSGQVLTTRVLRDNGDAETVRAALESVRRGAPYPKPSSRLVSRGRLEILETWLFRDDGMFQLRSLAQVQQGE